MVRRGVVVVFVWIAGCGPDSVSTAASTSETTQQNGTTTSTSVDETAESSSDTTASPPACDASCPMIPPGWSGPVAVVEVDSSAALPECQGAFGEESFTLGTMIDEPAANCVCECGQAFDFTCSASRIWGWEGGPTCDFPAVDLPSIELELGCNPLPEVLPPGPYTTEIGQVEAKCTASVRLSPEDRAEFRGWMRGCGQTASCDDGTCPAAPVDFPMLCIYTEPSGGSCPAEFPELRLGYAGLEDSRACADDVCECEPESRDRCTGTIALATGCDDRPGLEIGECTTSTEDASVVNVDIDLPTNPSATCWRQADSFMPSGGVFKMGGRYFCCRAAAD